MAATELYNSREETAQVGNSVGTRKWLCEWTERYTFTGHPIKGVSLYTEGTEDDGLGTDADRLVCESIKYQGKGAGTTIPPLPFNSCEVTASYKERQAFGGDCLESSKGDVRILTMVDATGLNPVQKRFVMKHITVPIYFLYNSGIEAALDAIAGKVNNAPWVDNIGGGGYDTGLVLFECYSCDEYQHEVLGRLKKVTYSLAVNYAGWNTVPAVGYTTTTISLYSAVSFAGLFTPGTRVV